MKLAWILDFFTWSYSYVDVYRDQLRSNWSNITQIIILVTAPIFIGWMFYLILEMKKQLERDFIDSIESDRVPDLDKIKDARSEIFRYSVAFLMLWLCGCLFVPFIVYLILLFHPILYMLVVSALIKRALVVFGFSEDRLVKNILKKRKDLVVMGLTSPNKEVREAMEKVINEKRNI